MRNLTHPAPGKGPPAAPPCNNFKQTVTRTDVAAVSHLRRGEGAEGREEREGEKRERGGREGKRGEGGGKEGKRGERGRREDREGRRGREREGREWGGKWTPHTVKLDLWAKENQRHFIRNSNIYLIKDGEKLKSQKARQKNWVRTNVHSSLSTMGTRRGGGKEWPHCLNSGWQKSDYRKDRSMI